MKSMAVARVHKIKREEGRPEKGWPNKSNGSVREAEKEQRMPEKGEEMPEKGKGMPKKGKGLSEKGKEMPGR